MPDSPADIASISSNPNVAVALVNAARPSYVPSDRYDLSTFGGRPNPWVFLGASTHIRELMDAVAELSSSEGNQNIACALRVEDYREIEIIIASSTEIKQATLDHIRSVWGDMVAISNLLLASSGRVGEPDTLIADKSRSLVHGIYIFCMHLVSKNFTEHLFVLRKWSQAYGKWYEDVEALSHTNKWPRDMDIMRPMAISVKKMLNHLSAYEISVAAHFKRTDEPSLEEFIVTMESVMKEGKELLRINSKCDDPLKIMGFLAFPKTSSRLKHCIEDLISFPLNIEKLRNFTSSRALSQVSQYKLQITPLNERIYASPVGPWPADPQSWNEVYEYVHRQKVYRFIGTEDDHDFLNLPVDPNELVVHPELKIATHLHTISGVIIPQEPGNHTPPFSYIAVSGLPCEPCAIWLSKLNSMDPELAVDFRGTSYGWPNNWCMPAMKTRELSEYMKDRAWDSYLEVQGGQYKRKSIKDRPANWNSDSESFSPRKK